MRMHYLQHVPFEGIAAIGEWASARGHEVSRTLLFEDATLPGPAGFDLLVVMGGPMNIYEHGAYPWLAAEKALIRDAVAAGRAVLGVCLGAQLIADVLGGPVTRGAHQEIGWYPVDGLPAAGAPVFAHFPARFTALHYHGDTFALPPGAVHTASTPACPNQAFSYAGGRVAGLQFHLEVTPQSLALLVENAPPPASAGKPWIQSSDELLSPTAPYADCRALLFELLDRMAATVTS
jgi:GMP synthase-like glutamine amidotransferase